MVSGNYFDVLRVQPKIVRFFPVTEIDDTQNVHAAAVISYSFWKAPNLSSSLRDRSTRNFVMLAQPKSGVTVDQAVRKRGLGVSAGVLPLWKGHFRWAIRSAFGADAARLGRHLLTATLMLSLGGGAVGLVIASWLGGSLRWLLPQSGHTRGSTGARWRGLVLHPDGGVCIGLALRRRSCAHRRVPT